MECTEDNPDETQLGKVYTKCFLAFFVLIRCDISSAAKIY